MRWHSWLGHEYRWACQDERDRLQRGVATLVRLFSHFNVYDCLLFSPVLRVSQRKPPLIKYLFNNLPWILSYRYQTVPRWTSNRRVVPQGHTFFSQRDNVFVAIQSENEYSTSAAEGIAGLSEHMQAIIDTLRNNGITKVPTIHNDKNPSGQYALKGLGKVDLYVINSLPLFDLLSMFWQIWMGWVRVGTLLEK